MQGMCQKRNEKHIQGIWRSYAAKDKNYIEVIYSKGREVYRGHMQQRPKSI